MLAQFTDRQKFYSNIFPLENVYFCMRFALIFTHIVTLKLFSVLYVVIYMPMSRKTFQQYLWRNEIGSMQDY
jgi:hypothetical protein